MQTSGKKSWNRDLLQTCDTLFILVRINMYKPNVATTIKTMITLEIVIAQETLLFLLIRINKRRLLYWMQYWKDYDYFDCV